MPRYVELLTFNGWCRGENYARRDGGDARRVSVMLMRLQQTPDKLGAEAGTPLGDKLPSNQARAITRLHAKLLSDGQNPIRGIWPTSCRPNDVSSNLK